MVRTGRLGASLASVVAAIVLAACGGSNNARVVARVASSQITAQQLAQEMSALAPEHLVPDPPHYSACISRRAEGVPESNTGVLEQECVQEYGALRQQALDQLVTTDWLLGEARERKLDVSSRDRASEQLRALATQGVRSPSPSQVLAYYKQHIQHFETTELRDVDLAEKLRSRAAAMKLVAEVQHGRSIKAISLHESIQKPSPGDESIITRTIFSARTNVVASPIPVGDGYYVIVVTRIVPPVRTPLARVRRSIERQLQDEMTRVALSSFISAWRSRWTARTDCSPGYVMQKCKQYRGPRTSESLLGFM
jgi:foldase protein PrsA